MWVPGPARPPGGKIVKTPGIPGNISHPSPNPTGYCLLCGCVCLYYERVDCAAVFGKPIIGHLAKEVQWKLKYLQNQRNWKVRKARQATPRWPGCFGKIPSRDSTDPAPRKSIPQGNYRPERQKRFTSRPRPVEAVFLDEYGVFPNRHACAPPD